MEEKPVVHYRSVTSRLKSTFWTGGKRQLHEHY
ncbi:hypothetical protein SAMN05446935_8498 [Burkholderia sp. YR290]|nr:hypothetical protein SAMN05446935_8498 [Burkholderia sp. YR290]